MRGYFRKMAIDDRFITTFIFGTKQEIGRYLHNHPDDQTSFNIGVVVEVVSVLLVPYTLPLFVDVMFRAGYVAFRSKHNFLNKRGAQEIPRSPGIVGIIREYVFDEKK